MNGYIEAGYVVGIGGVGSYAAMLLMRLRRAERLEAMRHRALAAREDASPQGSNKRSGAQ